MADDWDSEDFVPKAPKGLIKESWEDEEAEVKDSWEDEEEKPKAAAEKSKKPKNLPEVSKKIVNVKDMSEEEKKKAQEDADLAHATDLFGLGNSLDDISLNSKEECIDYANRLFARLNKHSNKTHYQDFIDELFKSLCKNMSADAIRKLSNSFKAFSDAKTAQERAAKQAESKAKVKPKINAKANSIKGDISDFLKDGYTGTSVAAEEFEEDDFM